MVGGGQGGRAIQQARMLYSAPGAMVCCAAAGAGAGFKSSFFIVPDTPSSAVTRQLVLVDHEGAKFARRDRKGCWRMQFAEVSNTITKIKCTVCFPAGVSFTLFVPHCNTLS